MPSIIGSLRAVLGIDTAQFDDGLQAAQGKLASFAHAGKIAGAAAAAAIAGAAVAMGAAIKETIDHADELSKAAQKFGVGIEQLSRLAYAADLSDVSLEGLGNGLKKLSDNMAQVASGTGQRAAVAFKALGINVTDASGHLRSSEAVMQDIAGRFGDMQDGATKTALAVAIFGKSGADLIPLLNSGKDGLAQMAAEADELGITLDQKTASAAEAFNDNLTRLHTIGKGVATQVTAGLIPGLVSLSNTIVAGAKNGQFMAEVVAALNGVFKALSVTGVVVGAVFDATFKTVSAVAKAMLQVVHGDFSGALATMNQKLGSFEGIGARISAAWRETGAAASAAGQAMAKDAGPAIESASNRAAKGLKRQKDAADEAAKAFEKLRDAALDVIAAYATPFERATEKARADLLALRAAFEAGAISANQFREAVSRIEGPVVTEADRAKLPSTDDFKSSEEAAQEWSDDLKRAAERAREGIADLPYTIDDIWSSFKNHDWARAFAGLESALASVQQAFSAVGTTADKVNAVAGIANGIGQVIGGKAGAALSNAAGAGQVAFMMTGNPVIALGAAAVAGLATALTGKPSNHAAIATLTETDATLVSSGKETSDTTTAVSSTADAILKGEAAIKAAGITLTETITKLDLGTRDMTHIFTSTGEELRSAVGDPAAAANTALRALLQSATYTDAAQKKLVDSMVAAGKGFDDIANALQAYTAAQQVGGALADQILQLTDPQAYDKKQVTDAIKAQRDSLAAAAEQGYYTADQLAALNAQLDRLQSLQLDQVLLKYADATDNLAQRQQDAADAVSKAKDDLKAAYDAQAQALQSNIQTFQNLADSLGKFRDSLTPAAATPEAGLEAAAAAFRAISGKTDAASLGKLQDVGQAYVDAAKAGAHDAVELARVQAQVRAATAAGVVAANAQVSLGQRQLDALNAQVAGLMDVNTSVLSVADAVAALQSALLAQARTTVTTPATANDNVDVAKYLADNPDLQANWDAGGVLHNLGPDLASAAKQHYLQQGQFEIAAGLRKFATGGGFRVGGLGGTDSKLAQLALTPGEYVNVTHGDSMAAMASELGALRADLRAIGVAMAGPTVKVAKFVERWDGDGLPATRDVA